MTFGQGGNLCALHGHKEVMKVRGERGAGDCRSPSGSLGLIEMQWEAKEGFK